MGVSSSVLSLAEIWDDCKSQIEKPVCLMASYQFKSCTGGNEKSNANLDFEMMSMLPFLLFLTLELAVFGNKAMLVTLWFQEEERKFIATLAENSSAGEEELLETIKSSASGEKRLST